MNDVKVNTPPLTSAKSPMPLGTLLHVEASDRLFPYLASYVQFPEGTIPQFFQIVQIECRVGVGVHVLHTLAGNKLKKSRLSPVTSKYSKQHFST